MLVEYLVKEKSFYDINGVQLLLKVSKSQAKKLMKQNVITVVQYLNRNLYLKDEVLELTNLKNLRDQIDLRIKPQEENEID